MLFGFSRQIFVSALVVLNVAAAGALSGCVYTRADSTSAPVVARPAKNPGSILITEADTTNRPYNVVGNISATARAINLVSSDPTREDVNEALRAEAARIGADAVIGVRYRSESQGLASRGKMVGEGQAVVFSN